MPVHWQDNTQKAPDNAGAFLHGNDDPPAYVITLWPYRSLPRAHFAGFIAVTFLMFLLPLLALLGTKMLWVLLPFLIGTLALVWILFERNYNDANMTETLSLWTDHIQLTRVEKNGDILEWQANPYWVAIDLSGEDDLPVPHYLTLRGQDRRVELGAFLSAEERIDLHRRLSANLHWLNSR